MLYGYIYRTDVLIEISEVLYEAGIPADLLVTVDDSVRPSLF